MAACPFLGSQRNFLLSKSFLRTSHSRKVGWKNMSVSSARRTKKPESDENRIKNSPHCNGISELPSALTELYNSTGVRGTREASAVDKMSST